MSTPKLEFKHIDRLGSDPRVFAYVLIAFAEQRDYGNFPADRRVPNGDEQVWVVYDDQMPVAFATHYQPSTDPMMWLDLLFVDPDYRRQGIGGELLALVGSQARQDNCTRVEWGTGVGNERMQGLTTKADGQMVGHYYRKDLPAYGEAKTP